MEGCAEEWALLKFYVEIYALVGFGSSAKANIHWFINLQNILL